VSEHAGGDHSTLVRTGFKAAAHFFVDTVARVPADAWERPGLGVWSVRALVGHTSRALLTVESYVITGAGQATIASAADYFLGALVQAADGATTAEKAALSAAVAERGRQAGLALGADPAGAVREIAARVTARVDATADKALVGTPWGGMVLIEYLPTRTLELTIHTMDLIAALSLDQPEPAPEEAVAVTFALVGELAHRRHLDTDLLLAATGRRALPAGYTVL
jgi:hypothetical protein